MYKEFVKQKEIKIRINGKYCCENPRCESMIYPDECWMYDYSLGNGDNSYFERCPKCLEEFSK